MFRIGINGIQLTIIVVNNSGNVLFDPFSVWGGNELCPLFSYQYKMSVKVVIFNFYICKNKVIRSC